jgi:3-oxoacyl-[acyl-carrier protein] reductase
MLNGKVAIVYGAGAIGSTVAKAFAAAGADVQLASRSGDRLEKVAREIRESGGNVETAVVDALDPESVGAHADRVAAEAGRIDICFNLISHGDVHGTPLIEMDLEDFVRPIDSIVRSTFLTAQATARHMIRQGEGVILIFGGEGEPMRDYYLGGTLVAFHAQETIRRQLAAELGPKGVRVVTIITGGIPETIGDEADPAIAQGIVEATMIGKAATYEDVGRVAVFAASDQARMMTAATLNISGGSVID